MLAEYLDYHNQNGGKGPKTDYVALFLGNARSQTTTNVNG